MTPQLDASFTAASWLARSRAHWRSEARALAVVAGVVLAIMLFRFVLPLGFHGVVEDSEPFDLGELVTVWGSDFCVHLGLALVMYVVIEPVRRSGPSAGWLRVAALAASTLVAAAGVTALRQGFMLLDGDADAWQSFWAVLPRFLFPGAMLVTVAEFHRRELQSLEAMRAAEAARNVLETQTLQARLRTLEAQIEPHFLFNTLATVRRLHQTDPVAGEAMMQRLMAYLRMALPALRGDVVTLGREAELVSAYLDLQKVRMGRRLDYGVDVPPALEGLRIPPMMLLTLVENAIKHGLAPQREGGRIDVAAAVDGGTLRLEVADTGRGFGGATSGGGTGLANIRARLSALFESAAHLTLAPRQPRGLTATITLPVANAPGMSAAGGPHVATLSAA
jgi:hypothetical protein